MRAGELRHIIHIQEKVGTTDTMGGETVVWKDFVPCDEWEATTAYELGDVIKPTTADGFYYVCSRAGTSGGSEPTFPAVLTQTVNDPDVAGAEWTCTGDGSINAALYPLRAKEVNENMRVELNLTHRIRIRYFSGITTAMRVLFGTRTFDIISDINPDERNIYLEFISVERT